MGLPCEPYDSDCEVKPQYKWADVFEFKNMNHTQLTYLLNQQGLMFPNQFTVSGRNRTFDLSMKVNFWSWKYLFDEIILLQIINFLLITLLVTFKYCANWM